MHASVRRYRAVDVEALLRQVQEEFVDRVKTVEGFVGYYVIDGGDGTVTSIIVGQTAATVEASNALAKNGSSSGAPTSSNTLPTSLRARYASAPNGHQSCPRPRPIVRSGASPALVNWSIQFPQRSAG
jgi:hypothetical protein